MDINDVWTAGEIAYLRSKGIDPSKITQRELDKRIEFGEFDDMEFWIDHWERRQPTRKKSVKKSV